MADFDPYSVASFYLVFKQFFLYRLNYQKKNMKYTIVYKENLSEKRTYILLCFTIVPSFITRFSLKTWASLFKSTVY